MCASHRLGNNKQPPARQLATTLLFTSVSIYYIKANWHCGWMLAMCKKLLVYCTQIKFWFNTYSKFNKRIVLIKFRNITILLYNTLQSNRLVSTGMPLTLSTLSNFNGLFYSLFWIKLKQSVGVKGLMCWTNNFNKVKPQYFKFLHMCIDELKLILNAQVLARNSHTFKLMTK